MGFRLCPTSRAAVTLFGPISCLGLEVYGFGFRVWDLIPKQGFFLRGVIRKQVFLKVGVWGEVMTQTARGTRFE